MKLPPRRVVFDDVATVSVVSNCGCKYASTFCSSYVDEEDDDIDDDLGSQPRLNLTELRNCVFIFIITIKLKRGLVRIFFLF